MDGYPGVEPDQQFAIFARCVETFLRAPDTVQALVE
jgi:hypothetical protein